MDALSRLQLRIRQIQSLLEAPTATNGRVRQEPVPGARRPVPGRNGPETGDRGPIGLTPGPPSSARGPHPPGAAFQPFVAEAAERTGLSPDLIGAVIAAESGFRADAVSPAGAQGLMQLMPGTARALGVADPFDPRQNILGGAEYLRQQLERFGTVEKALAAYNAGPGAVSRHGGVPPYPETRHYVERVLGTLRRFFNQRE
jgi:soluble lytic murein transglycosylase-like protein